MPEHLRSRSSYLNNFLSQSHKLPEDALSELRALPARELRKVPEEVWTTIHPMQAGYPKVGTKVLAARGLRYDSFVRASV